MNGIKPAFLENTVPESFYYEAPNPYMDAPACNVNLLALSRYARSVGKKLTDLTKEEVNRFSVKAV